jgi:4-amino-4-deoxy-L-arabinose transferase-like glycosyltransferase
MKPPDFSIAASRRVFWLTFAGTLLLKIVIAAGFPITGDEAFFYQWGVRPAWGYSDHPPMVGWLLAVLHGISDAPLVLFMAVSAWCYVRANASADRGVGWYALAGLFIGLAFLSKYFAVLLGMAYGVHILGWRRERWWALALMFAAALPSIAVNVVFNMTHGWTNVMFNVFNRNEGGRWNIETPVTYVAMVAYLLTPWLLW